MNISQGRRQTVFWGASALTGFPLSAQEQKSDLPVQPAPSAFGQKMNALLRREPGALAAGLVVSIHQGGQSVYQHQSGWANVLQAQAVTADTPFELASVSKPLTALAILQLMEKGLLSLQEPVTRYLPELPSTWSAIDVHCLLSHQSGIPDVLNEWPKRQLDRLTLEKLLPFFIKNPGLKFAPRQRGEYSNTNYVLLAEIISRVSGQSLDAYWRTHVFEPLGMDSSFNLDGIARQPKPSALHYAVGEWIDGIHYALQGAIGLKSSALDMHRFMRGVMSLQLIAATSYQLMTQVHTTFEDGRMYGYGWYITRPEIRSLLPWTTGGRALGHTGRLGAFRTAVYFDNQDQWDLVVLSNGGPSTEALMVNVLALTRQHFEH